LYISFLLLYSFYEFCAVCLNNMKKQKNVDDLNLFSVHIRNYKRVAAVWMDEYAEFVYKKRPHYRQASLCMQTKPSRFLSGFDIGLIPVCTVYNMMLWFIFFRHLMIRDTLD
jgi:hypothetical protein